MKKLTIYLSAALTFGALSFSGLIGPLGLYLAPRW